MNNETLPSRSPLLMSPDKSALLVIDVQERLLPLIPNRDALTANIADLIQAARLLNVEVMGSEQYPQGLGHTTPELAAAVGRFVEKSLFSCRQCHGEFSALKERGIDQILLAGIETHVCVQQTALDLVHMGFDVWIAVDAVGARREIDHSTALRRMEACGVNPTTTESAMFEWCVDSACPSFKAISKMVKSRGV